MTAERWCSIGARLGEGPLWDVRSQRLTFVDLAAGVLYAVRRDATVTTVAELESPLCAALPGAAEGQFVLVRNDHFDVLDGAGALTGLTPPVEMPPHTRFNDAKCDPSGRLVVGSMSMRREPDRGVLYRLDDGPTTTVLMAGLTVSNGLGWTPDGRGMYLADTADGLIYHCEYDAGSGAVGALREFARVPDPDGLCVDDDGGVWIALWGQGEIRRFAPDGCVDTVVDVPSPKVTSCCFLEDLLIITTAGETATGRGTGDLFAVSPGVTGAPATPWRGVR